MNYFEFNDTIYGIDMEKFMDFVSNNKDKERDTNTTITQIFSDTGDAEQENIMSRDISNNNFRVVSKEISETRANNNAVFNNVRYDFIRILLNCIINPYYNPDGSMIIVNSENEMFLGQKIAFNTLLSNGIIYEIK